jgi:enamine deaminase RidA (YjgF/YER057c/UK114 family)
MNELKNKLAELGHELPAVSKAVASYVPYVISGNLVFVSGQIPFLNGQAMHQGIVGKDLTLEQAREAAIACGLNILAQVNDAVSGDWSRVSRCVKLGGFVACTSAFTDHPKVINGASELIASVMGESGQHARFAVGAPCLPLNCAVEIDAVFELNAL